MLLKDLDVNKLDAIIFIGGGGAEQYFNDITAHQLLKSAKEKGKIYGAICIAPVILANAGLLKDKNATVFSSEIETIKNAGAIYSTDDVVVDGKLVTANGPAAAKRFGEAIVTLLKL
jgi:protease I